MVEVTGIDSRNTFVSEKIEIFPALCFRNGNMTIFRVYILDKEGMKTEDRLDTVLRS